MKDRVVEAQGPHCLVRVPLRGGPTRRAITGMNRLEANKHQVTAEDQTNTKRSVQKVSWPRIRARTARRSPSAARLESKQTTNDRQWQQIGCPGETAGLSRSGRSSHEFGAGRGLAEARKDISEIVMMMFATSTSRSRGAWHQQPARCA